MHLGDQIDFGRETSEGFSNIIHEVESTLSLFGLNNAEKNIDLYSFRNSEISYLWKQTANEILRVLKAAELWPDLRKILSSCQSKKKFFMWKRANNVFRKKKFRKNIFFRFDSSSVWIPAMREVQGMVSEVCVLWIFRPNFQLMDICLVNEHKGGLMVTYVSGYNG